MVEVPLRSTEEADKDSGEDGPSQEINGGCNVWRTRATGEAVRRDVQNRVEQRRREKGQRLGNGSIRSRLPQ